MKTMIIILDLTKDGAENPFVKVVNYTLFWQFKCKHAFYKHSCLLMPETVKFSGSKFHAENKHPIQSAQ